MNTTTPRDFNKEAQLWDEKPQRLKLADDVAAAITREVPITREMDILDFGCGTGLLTLRLQPVARSVVGTDSSEGMLTMLNQKIDQLQLANVTTQLCDVEKNILPSGPFDVVTSNMALHHIDDTEALIKSLTEILTSGGYLCLSDLDYEGGHFHDDNTGVFHFGFERSLLRSQLVEVGLVEIRDVTATSIKKPHPEGKEREFSVFLFIARKP